MATGAAGDAIFRGVFEGSISGHDLEISKRPYHRNCGCALHKSRGNCSHSSRYMTVSYPIRRSWSEGCLSLVAAASAAASGHSSPCSSPSVAVSDISKRNLLPVNEDGEDLVFIKIPTSLKIRIDWLQARSLAREVRGSWTTFGVGR